MTKRQTDDEVEDEEEVTPDRVSVAIQKCHGEMEKLGFTGTDFVRELKRVKKFEGKTSDEIEEMYHAGKCEESELPLAVYQRLNKGR